MKLDNRDCFWCGGKNTMIHTKVNIYEEAKEDIATSKLSLEVASTLARDYVLFTGHGLCEFMLCSECNARESLDSLERREGFALC